MMRRGVISAEMLLCSDDYKQHLLLYDELYVPTLDDFLRAETAEHEVEAKQAMELLASKGIVKEPLVNVLSDDLIDDDVTEALSREFLELHDPPEEFNPEDDESFIREVQGLFARENLLTRTCIHVLWRDYGEITYPVMFPFEAASNKTLSIQEVLSVIFEQFPLPAPTVPLKEIIEFKLNSDTQFKFAKLWNWIRKVSHEGQDRIELQDELEWILTEYRHHLGLFTKDVQLQRVGALISTPPAIIEDLLKFHWGAAAQRLFELKRHQIAAHEKELKLPGSELAYLKEAIDLMTDKD